MSYSVYGNDNNLKYNQVPAYANVSVNNNMKNLFPFNNPSTNQNNSVSNCNSCNRASVAPAVVVSASVEQVVSAPVVVGQVVSAPAVVGPVVSAPVMLPEAVDDSAYEYENTEDTDYESES